MNEKEIKKNWLPTTNCNQCMVVMFTKALSTIPWQI